jgi:hypothetical protein
MFAALNAFLTRSTAGYFLSNSLRFRASASAYLNRTFGTPTNNKIQTFSLWVKRGTITSAARQALFSGADGVSNNNMWISFETNDTFSAATGGTPANDVITTQVFRDPAAWYHLVIAFDTTQATASDRVKVYVNGSQVTSFGTANYPPQNQILQFAYPNANNKIGTWWNNTTSYFDGEMAEVYFVDGQALAPTAFGASSIYNQWLPKKYSGTYGTNGFYLPFSATSTTSYAGSFNGSSQYLSVAKNSAFEPAAAQPWTVEAWVYITSFTNANEIFAYTNAAVAAGTDLGTYMLVNATTGTITGGMYNGVNQYVVTSSAGLPLNAWVHCATVSSGSVITVYVNGISVGSTSTSLAPNVPVSATLKIGYFDSINLRYLTGQVSNFRFVKGTAVYTANFVPPTTALTAVTNTSLLTLQNATIVDNSTNAFTITNTGTVVTSVQSPFLNTTVLTADSSGNGNNWTPNNISLTAGSTYDSLTDVPTLTSATAANYAVLNPLDHTVNSYATLANGNLQALGNTATDSGAFAGTIAANSGLYYWESTRVGTAGLAYAGATQPGITAINADTLNAIYRSDGSTRNFGVAGTSLSTWNTAGDVIMVALDMTNGAIYYGKNGTWLNSGVPTSGASKTGALYTWAAGTYTFAPIGGGYTSGNGVNVNFGQQPFTYTAPTGFLALNTFNI